MWRKIKNFYNLATSVLAEKNYDLFPVLKEELNRRRDEFKNILKHSASVPGDHDKLKKGQFNSSEFKIEGRVHPSIVEEALTLGSFFNLNEYLAIQLLLESEEEIQYFNGLNRGQTAILLYYDTKKQLLNILKLLLLARQGKTWLLDENTPSDITSFINEFTKDIIGQGLIKNLIDQIDNFDWSRTEEQLIRINGLGYSKHRKQLKNLIDEVKLCITECIFDASCQVTLSLSDTLVIINYLKQNCTHVNNGMLSEPSASTSGAQVSTTTTTTTTSAQSTATTGVGSAPSAAAVPGSVVACDQVKTSPTVDDHFLFLIMAILYSFDYSYFELNAENGNYESADDYFASIKDNYVGEMFRELTKLDMNEWSMPGLKALFQFAFQIFIANLNSLLSDAEEASSLKLRSNLTDLATYDEDETLINKSIELSVFQFITQSILTSNKFYTEKYFTERMHNLIADFIFKMPDKIKELRNHQEEIQMKFGAYYDEMQAQGSYQGYGAHGYSQSIGCNMNYGNSTNMSQAYNQGAYNRSQSTFNPYYNHHYHLQSQMLAAQKPINHDFEDLLNLIGEFYKKDPLCLQLCLNYWIAETDFSYNVSSVRAKPTQKQISLYKFVRYFLSSGDALTSSQYIAYINMLIGLSTGKESAEHCFLLLQNTANVYELQSAKISLNHIFTALCSYHETFRMGSAGKQRGATGYGSASAGTSQAAPSMVNFTQKELQALISVTKLIKQIAYHNEKARLVLYEYNNKNDFNNLNNQYPNCINDLSQFHNTNESYNSNQSLSNILFGLVTCPIPILLKSELLNLLATFALAPQLSTNMWNQLEKSQLLITIPQTTTMGASVLPKGDIRTELDETETRDESYPLLRAFLSLMLNLVSLSQVPDNLGIGIRPKESVLGFQPYLQFLVNSVYLKFYHRAYKFDNQLEKWEIANMTLEIFYQLIQKCEISVNEFQRLIAQSEMASHANELNAYLNVIKRSNYSILFELIQNGPLARMLFLLLNDSTNFLFDENYSATALQMPKAQEKTRSVKSRKMMLDEMRSMIEKTSLISLRLIDLLVDKQEMLIELMKNLNLNTNEMGIEKLLLSINPNTNKADCFQSLLFFIIYNQFSYRSTNNVTHESSILSSPSLIRHSYYSLNILYKLSVNHSFLTNQFLTLFLSNFQSQFEQYEIMSAFVNFIDGNLEVPDDLFNDERLFHSNSLSKLNNLNYVLTLNEIQLKQYNAINLNKLNSETNSKIKAACRLKALKFILFYLKIKQPPVMMHGGIQANISYLLLGFDIRRQLNTQKFLNPGTKINYSANSRNGANMIDPSLAETLTIVPRNCLHSILNIINRVLVERAESDGMLSSSTNQLTSFDESNKKLVLINMLKSLDISYEILNQLCLNQLFNQQLLAYLRNDYDFVCKHLKFIPFRLNEAEIVNYLSYFKSSIRFSHLLHTFDQQTTASASSTAIQNVNSEYSINNDQNNFTNDESTINIKNENDTVFNNETEFYADATSAFNDNEAMMDDEDESGNQEMYELKLFDDPSFIRAEEAQIYKLLVEIHRPKSAAEFALKNATNLKTIQSGLLSSKSMNQTKLNEMDSLKVRATAIRKIYLNEVKKELNFLRQLYYSIDSWVNNVICIEFQMLATDKTIQNNNLTKLIQMLINSSNGINEMKSRMKQTNIFGNKTSKFDNLFYLNRMTNNNDSSLNNSGYQDAETKYSAQLDGESSISSSVDINKTKLYYLLRISNFEHELPKPLNLNYFDSNLIEKVIDTCKYSSHMLSYDSMASAKETMRFYDAVKVNNILMDEIKQINNANISKKNLMIELNHILNNIKERNLFQLKFLAMKKYFESYKRLVECVILIAPIDSLNLNLRFKFLAHMTNLLLDMILKESIVIELSYPVASIIFTLVKNLRQVLIELSKQNDSNAKFKQTKEYLSSNWTSLSSLFKKSIEYLLDSSLTNYKVRTYIYGAIINYLMIFDRDAYQYTNQDGESSSLEDNAIFSQAIYENNDIINRNYNGLMKIICSDSSDGHNITAMMGLSLLNKIIQLAEGHQQKWLNGVSDNGYIKCIINSIAKTDNQLLEECFVSGISNEKIIYIFETKISLLITIANDSYGAKLLLKNQLLDVLSACSIFDLRSRFDGWHVNESNGAPGGINMNRLMLANKYYQIFFPILKLVITLLNAIGTDNSQVKSQVAQFVYCHAETFSHLLRSKVFDLSMLEETKLVTSLLSKLAPYDELSFNNLNQNVEIDLNSYFSRLQKEFINLVSIYFMPDQMKRLRKEIEMRTQEFSAYFATTRPSDKEISIKISCYFVEIQSNICTFCYKATKASSSRALSLIFSPALIDQSQLHPYSPLNSAVNVKNLPLSLLIEFIRYKADNLEKEIETEIDLSTKRANLNDLVELEIKQLVGDYVLFQKLPSAEKRLYIMQQISGALNLIRQEIKLSKQILEMCLLILWRHTEFYLVNADLTVSQDAKQLSNRSGIFDDSGLSRSRGAPRDELGSFTQGLLTFLNQDFFKRLHDVVKRETSKADENGADQVKDFLDIIVKRLQRLIHLNTF